jgi:hypothetical protein
MQALHYAPREVITPFMIQLTHAMIREDETVIWNKTLNPWIDVSSESGDILRWIQPGVYAIYAGVHQVASNGSKASIYLNNELTKPLITSQVMNDTSLTLQAVYPFNIDDTVSMKIFTDSESHRQLSTEVVVIKLT